MKTLQKLLTKETEYRHWYEKSYSVPTEKEIVPMSPPIQDSRETFTIPCLSENPEKVAVIISHQDLDGVASACVAYRYIEGFGYEDIMVVLDWNPTKEKTNELFQKAEEQIGRSLGDGDVVMILDREMIGTEWIEERPDVAFIHIDHHEGNHYEPELLEGEFGNVLLYRETDIHHCGASLAYQVFCQNGFDPERRYESLFERVNLWDTFLWKQMEEGSMERKIGQQYGTLDKTLTTESLCRLMFQAMRMSDVSTEPTQVASEIIQPIVEQCATVFEEAFEEEYRKQCQNVVIVYLEECGYYMAHFTHCHPVFGSMVKDRYFSEWMNTIYSTGDSYDKMLKVIVCWNEFGGTVYVEDDDYDPVKAYDLARTFGKYFGCSGGGHAKAAGFRHVKEGASPYSVYLKIDQVLCNAFEYYQICYPNEDSVYVTVSKKVTE